MNVKFENLFKLKMQGAGEYIVCVRGFCTNDKHGSNPYDVILADYACQGSDKEIFCRVYEGGGGGFRLNEIVSMTPLKRGVKKYRKIFEDALTKSKALV